MSLPPLLNNVGLRSLPDPSPNFERQHPTKYSVDDLVQVLESQPIDTQLRIGIIPVKKSGTFIDAKYVEHIRIGDMIQVWLPFYKAVVHTTAGTRGRSIILIKDESGGIYLSRELLAVILSTAYYSNHNGVLEKSLEETKAQVMPKSIYAAAPKNTPEPQLVLF